MSALIDTRMLDALSFIVPLDDAPGERVVGMIGRPWVPTGLIRRDMLRAIRRPAAAA
jgi:hypothetical protein